MYDNYIFDLYGTLADINTDEQQPELWKHMTYLYGYDNAYYAEGELRREYGRLVEKEKAEAGKRHPEYEHIDIKLEKVFAQLYSQKGVSAEPKRVTATAETFRCFSTNRICLYDGVIDLLDSLKSKGKKIYLLTNAQRVFTANELRMLGLTDCFDGICISSDEECSKPDRHYFEILFNRFNLKKERSIMIGNDFRSDIGGAADFGIDSLYIHQSISPEITGKLRSRFSIMDGDVRKIKTLVLR